MQVYLKLKYDSHDNIMSKLNGLNGVVNNKTLLILILTKTK